MGKGKDRKWKIRGIRGNVTRFWDISTLEGTIKNIKG